MLDKHSTGGVGDKVSLMLAPIVAACGGAVPMISGRGLGHTGGTLDKLDACPATTARPDLERLREVVDEVGCAIVGQTAELAPADRRLYAVRDATGTVESIPLIVASILSKKLAAGLDALVMDVKFGSGAFMAERAAAEELARALVEVAGGAGLPTVALLTDMDEVLGPPPATRSRCGRRSTISPGTREPRLHEATRRAGRIADRAGRPGGGRGRAGAAVEQRARLGRRRRALRRHGRRARRPGGLRRGAPISRERPSRRPPPPSAPGSSPPWTAAPSASS